MRNKLQTVFIIFLSMSLMVMTSIRLPADTTSTCGGASTTVPFNDVAGNAFFCQIAEAFFSGLTNGTTATTYSPSQNVAREQMAAFITRTQDSALRRGNRRAALNQWATPVSLPQSGRTALASSPAEVRSDGLDLWVASTDDVRRVRSTDGSTLGVWTGVTNAFGVLVARGRIYVTGVTDPGHLYRIDPSQAPGPVFTLSATVGAFPVYVTTDGQYLWTANEGGSISRVDPDSGTTINFSTGFIAPEGILFDGSNLWVADFAGGVLRKVDTSGNIIQNVTVGSSPAVPVFDGSNIWVPNFNGNSISVVRARDGVVLATLTGNGLNGPRQAAFDGQRILVTNLSGNSLSMWNAADLTPMGTFSTGAATGPYGVCSDGINFWITLEDANQLARF
jgi:sugar lactone lactonase YvrE